MQLTHSPFGRLVACLCIVEAVTACHNLAFGFPKLCAQILAQLPRLGHERIALLLVLVVAHAD